MESTFFQKVALTVIYGFFAACLLWAMEHIVFEAMWETSNEGWKQSLHGGTPTPKP
jgi:hypothetical protein